MNYEDMSDFEINKAVLLVEDVDGDIESITCRNTKMKCINSVAVVKFKGIDEPASYNPCNNPSDAWPIILQTCMTIELPDPNLGGIGTNTIYNPMGADWYCDYEDKGECFRAAMICFLKMKDAEK